MRDLNRRLIPLDEEWPPPWDPLPGEMLIGNIVRFRTLCAQGRRHRACILQREDGRSRVSVFLSSRPTLRDLFDQAQLKRGDAVGIGFRGPGRYLLVPNFCKPGGDLEPESIIDPAGLRRQAEDPEGDGEDPDDHETVHRNGGGR